MQAFHIYDQVFRGAKASFLAKCSRYRPGMCFRRKPPTRRGTGIGISGCLDLSFSPNSGRIAGFPEARTIRDSPVPYRAGGGHRSTKESRPRALRMQMVLGCRMNRERRPTNGKGTDTPSSVMLYIRDRKGGEPNYFSVYMISYSRGKVKSSRCLFTNYSRMKIDPFRIMSGLFARLICERHFAIPRAVFAAHFSAFTLFSGYALYHATVRSTTIP